MSWDRIIGQDRVKKLLWRSVQKNQVAHAYLFHGEYGVGKDAVAIEFARLLNCINRGDYACGACQSCRWINTLHHPDVFLIFPLPTGKNEESWDDPIAVLSDDAVSSIREQIHMKATDPYHRIEIPKANFIKINSIRQIRRESSLAQYERGRKIFIIINAEMMNAEASNSLLRTLEEPPGQTVLILTTAHKEQLLPTIISRCQVVDFDSLSEKDIEGNLIRRDGVDPGSAAAAAILSNGSFVRAREILSSDMEKYRIEVVQFLRLVLGSDRIKLAKEIERLCSEYERKDADRWLRTLELWLRSAFLLSKCGIETEKPVFKHEELTRFVKKYFFANLSRAQQDVERSIALLGKNVYIPLIFLDLGIALRSAIENR